MRSALVLTALGLSLVLVACPRGPTTPFPTVLDSGAGESGWVTCGPTPQAPPSPDAIGLRLDKMVQSTQHVVESIDAGARP